MVPVRRRWTHVCAREPFMNGSSARSQHDRPGTHGAVTATVLIFLVFFVHAAWPVPDVNEPHYLGKARHYWNPDWAHGDFFLESSDAHVVFYWLFGWLSLAVPLPAMAWIGRLATWLLLAWAWRRLSWALLPRPWYAVLSAGLFVALLQRCHLAGEWVVGGVEAKGFAYVFVLLGLEALVRGAWNRVWWWLGAATAMHVIVGGWSLLIAGFVWLLDGSQRTPLREMRSGLIGGAVMACVGLVPALELSWGVAPEIAAEANVIYVYQRLPHHLNPLELRPGERNRRLVVFGTILLVLIAMCLATPADRRQQRLRRFVLGAVLIWLAGWAICIAAQVYRAQAAAVLRYYWFRLADVAVPLAFAQTAVLAISRTERSQSRRFVAALVCALGIVGVHLGDITLRRWHNPHSRADQKMRVVDDWKDICRWIVGNLESDAVFLTPRMNHTFKWRTGRAEVVTYKDIPQNAEDIVEWWRRMQAVHGYERIGGRPTWRRLGERGEQQLQALGRQFDAQYLVTTWTPGLRLPMLYRNASFALYRLEGT